MELSVILPTYNERESLSAIRPRLERALAPFDAEIIVVDDGSPDGTGPLVREFARTGRWSLVERAGPSGLATAVLEGFRHAQGTVVLVMDADGSHPPETIGELVGPIERHEAEFVLASRFAPGGSDAGLVGLRRLVSWAASRLARPLTTASDPMSGFFAFRRTLLERGALAPVGYKIGLEVLVKCRPSPVLEVPFAFAERVAGESKLGSRQIAGYLHHVLRLYRWRFAGPGRASSTR